MCPYRVSYKNFSHMHSEAQPYLFPVLLPDGDFIKTNLAII